MVGSGISNWLTATSPFASGTSATSSALTSALLPGMTTMVLSEAATVMIAVPLCVSGVSLIEPGSMPCALRNVLQLSPERILAQPPDQRGLRAEPRRRDRLVRALAARKIQHLPAGDGLADLGMAIGGRHHIHVDAAGDEDAPHDNALTKPRP